MTLAELARLAGVSRTTASHVINGQGPARRIKPATISTSCYRCPRSTGTKHGDTNR